MAKFWHYTIWGENGEDGSRVNLNRNLGDETFSGNLTEVYSDEDKTYYVEFQVIGGNRFHGRISRVKDEDSFIRRGPDDNGFVVLSSETGGGGEAGERKNATAEFGLVRRESNLHILLERGFQTPGIGIITSYISNNIQIDEDYEVKKETKMGPDAEDKLDDLMGKELKSIDINFKKNPTTYPELDLDSALDTMTGDDYKFHFGLTLERGNNEPEETEEGLSKVLSAIGVGNDTSNQPITNSVRQLDIPKMMSTFEIVAGDGDEEIAENLADTIRREEIDTTEYGYFDRDLGERLCDCIEDEL